MERTSEAPQRLSGEERRAQIIEVATRIFAQKGFSGTTMREVAAAAGISETLIFQHFGSKENLYRCVLAELQTRCPDIPSLAEHMARKDDARVFSLLASHLVHHLAENAAFSRLVMFTALEGPPLADSSLPDLESPLIHVLQDYIATRVRDGAFKAMDPLLAARSFIAMVTHYGAQRQLLGGRNTPLSHQEMVKTLVAIFLQGLMLGERNTFFMQEADLMEKVTLSVPAMYADHHVQAVRRALTGLPGVEKVVASAALKKVTVMYDPVKIKPDKLQDSLQAAGYGPNGDQPPPTGLPRQGDPGWQQLDVRVTQTNRKDLEMSGDFRKY